MKEERERLGYNQIDFAAIGGASNRSQVDWEKGRQVPNAEFLAKIAEVGADIQYIVTGKIGSAELIGDENRLVVGFRMLDTRGKAGVLALVDGMSPKENTAIKYAGQIGQVVEGNQTVRAPLKLKISTTKKKP